MSVIYTAMVIVPCAAYVTFDIINPHTISPKKKTSDSVEVNVVDTTDHPLFAEEIDNVVQALPPFDCMSADPKHYSLVCEVTDDPNITGWSTQESHIILSRVVNPG